MVIRFIFIFFIFIFLKKLKMLLIMSVYYFTLWNDFSPLDYSIFDLISKTRQWVLFMNKNYFA